MKKRVLIISPFASPNIGGVESHLDKLTKICIKNNLFPILFTYQPLTTKVLGKPHEVTDNYEIHRLRWFGNNWFPKLEKYFPLVFLYLFPGLFVFTLTYYLKNYKSIYAIHAHGFVAGAIARILTRLHRVTSVISTHAVYNFEKRPLLNSIIKSMLSGFNTILAVSEVSRNEILTMGFSSEQVKVHPNWIDTDTFKPINFDKTLFKFDKKFNILFLARLIEQKGINLVLESSSRLKDVGFHIVGNGPLEESVRKFCDTADNVSYYGILSQNKPEEFEKLLFLLNKCDFLISPYLYDEGFSTTLIESLACGTPLILTNRGSPPTFISNTVAHFLTKEPTSEEIIEVVKDLSESNRYTADECRKYALEHFGTANANVILNAYKNNGL